MSLLAYIIVFSLIGSVFSLLGGVAILSGKVAKKVMHVMPAFAAGALLSASFFDLLPEAAELGEGLDIFPWMLLGVLVFFLVEHYLRWFHYHPHEHAGQLKPTVPLIVMGDTLHNFIDGMVIALTFLADVRLGVVTTLAIAAHEIPQEISDFGILLSAGIKKSKVVAVNIISSLATLVGALLIYLIGQSLETYLPYLLAVSAGLFIYIALSDLVPEIHHGHGKRYASLQVLVLLIGLLSVYVPIQLLE